MGDLHFYNISVDVDIGNTVILSTTGTSCMRRPFTRVTPRHPIIYLDADHGGGREAFLSFGCILRGMGLRGHGQAQPTHHSTHYSNRHCATHHLWAVISLPAPPDGGRNSLTNLRHGSFSLKTWGILSTGEVMDSIYVDVLVGR